MSKELFIDQLITEGRKDILQQFRILMHRWETFETLERVHDDPYFIELSKRVANLNGSIQKEASPPLLESPKKEKKYAHLSMKEAIIDILSRESGLTNDEIAQRLIEGGFHFETPHPRASVQQRTHEMKVVHLLKVNQDQRPGKRYSLSLSPSVFGTPSVSRKKSNKTPMNHVRQILERKPEITQAQWVLNILKSIQEPMGIRQITDQMRKEKYPFKNPRPMGQGQSIYACIRNLELKGLVQKHLQEDGPMQWSAK